MCPGTGLDSGIVTGNFINANQNGGLKFDFPVVTCYILTVNFVKCRYLHNCCWGCESDNVRGRHSGLGCRGAGLVDNSQSNLPPLTFHSLVQCYAYKQHHVFKGYSNTFAFS